MVRLAGHHMTHTLKQNKGARTECETGRDVPHEAASPAQAAGTPSLLGRKFPGPRSLL